MWERNLARWAEQLRPRIAIPARLALWDGREFDFGRHGEPRVTLRANDASALAYLLQPSLDRLGEAYVRGKIDIEGRVADAIELAFDLAHSANSRLDQIGGVLSRFSHNRSRDAEAIAYHYDVSDQFYASWLDPEMVYSCAYFERGDEDLATAQRQKIDLILTKLKLEPGQTLLDIGCGWGALVLRAAEHYGAHCVGITLSRNQYEHARQRVEAAGLADRVEIRLQDYRDVHGQFDRISSVGMFEHVGLKNLPAYFNRINALLADDGLALNHGITTSDPESRDTPFGAGSFIDRYVFPGGELPHLSLALRAAQQGGLEVLDVENLRRHYARTLALWSHNFEQNQEAIRELVSDPIFRIWRVYLIGCAHAFEHDLIAIYQILCHKAGRSSGQLDWSRRYMYAEHR
ncbi:class I SAM-dependent methyltransferase [Niveibacterium terrae]|uniref:class I SAM-dependent methyltransferase n=1 Tax=Niveibacterium terrae TaxID=3373598 RepID=UPI003A924F14